MPSETSLSNGFPGTSGRSSSVASAQPENLQVKAQDALRRDDEHLRGLLKEKEEQLRRVEAELDVSQKQMVEDADTIKHLHWKIAELESLVNKQKQTISNQSKALSDPKILRKKHSAAGILAITPHRQGSGLVKSPFSTNENHGVYEHPPPAFSLRSSSSTISRVSLPPPSPAGPSHPFGNDHQGGLSPTRTLHPRDSSGSLVSPSSAHFDLGKGITDFASKFQDLWTNTETFGQVHANVPNIYRDSKLDKQVKEYLMATSDKMSASRLLANPATRYFLIAKLINFYLVRDVLKITVVKEFDAMADTEIGQIKKQMFPDTPPTIRHLMIIAMATRVENLKNKVGFTEFCQKRIRYHTTKLWQLVGPLTHDAGTKAWSDLSVIVSVAHAFAIEMYSAPLEYKLDFPDVLELFNPGTMINRDSFISTDPQAFRVGLGITPIVRIRNNAEKTAPVQLAHLGNVLLRQPPRGPRR